MKLKTMIIPKQSKTKYLYLKFSLLADCVRATSLVFSM